ncbi:MAG: YebC/PmpR family DNA-binding transcriptional regulator [Gemmatimonadota bacterium]|nr:YebC/PmpR family DNA-binding transcriptional regulator [Gemmatimonadota bacterium]
MSGHSKWSTIKRKKAAEDRRRGKIFSKLSREIAVAAREGGGDPEFNPRLRTAIDNAKAQNMPADNIERAIQRGTGDLPGVSYEPATYEGYGPGGVALFIECLTDNENRTVAAVRHVLEKHGGNLGKDGSVSWMFDQKGRILIDAGEHDEETVFLTAIDAGAEDVVEEEGLFRVTTPFEEFHAVQDALHDVGVEFEEAELAMEPSSRVRVDGAEARKVLRLVEELEDEDDVQKVASNFDISEEILAEAS